LANFAGRKRNDWQAKEAIEAIDPSTNNKLRAYAEDHFEKFNKPTGFTTLRKLMGPTYLGFNLASPILNLTQPVAMTYPLTAKYLPTGKAEAVWLSSTKSAFEYVRNKETFAKKNPQLAPHIDQFVKQAITNEQQMLDLVGATKSGSQGVINDVATASMKLFSKSEQFNRIHAAITGMKTWDAMPASKRAGLDKVEFIEDFVYTSQGMYNKANLPKVATRSDTRRLMFTFRMFPATWLSMLKNEGVNPAVAARMIGSLVALGGVNAIPGWNVLEKSATIAGIDMKGAQRDMLGDSKAADAFMYGLPMLGGINLSGAMGLFNVADQERSPIANLVRTIGGAPVDFLYGKPMKAISYYQQHPGTTAEKLSRASEAILPRGLSNMKAAARSYMDGMVTTPSMEPVIKNPSMYDLGLKAVSINPASFTKAYEKFNRGQLLKEELLGGATGYSHKIAYARINGDREREIQLRAEMQAKGIKPSTSAIKKQIDRLTRPEDYRESLIPKRGRAEYRRINSMYRDE
jgi:hypothetical protein